MAGEYYRNTVAEVDLDAVFHNVRQFKKRLPAETRLMVAVKANGYGHGAIPVAKTALEAGATDLAVAFIDEGIALRQAGIHAPILTLGYTPQAGISPALEYNIALTVFDSESLQGIHRQAGQFGKKARIHLKMDTGMGRVGVWGESLFSLAVEAQELNNIELEGLYTHFASADEGCKEYTRKQHQRLVHCNARLLKKGIHIPLVHCSNSAAAIDLPEFTHGMVRIGISLYGYYPSEEVNQERISLIPALTLKTQTVQVKKPIPGTGVSYGSTYYPEKDRWIATLPVGYGDGLSRLLSNRGFALVKGQRVPIVGRVCMDQTMVDVTDVMPVMVGEEAVLYGSQGQATITVEEVATLMGTIPYEVTCLLGHRVPRIYKKAGRSPRVDY